MKLVEEEWIVFCSKGTLVISECIDNLELSLTVDTGRIFTQGKFMLTRDLQGLPLINEKNADHLFQARPVSCNIANKS